VPLTASHINMATVLHIAVSLLAWAPHPATSFTLGTRPLASATLMHRAQLTTQQAPTAVPMVARPMVPIMCDAAVASEEPSSPFGRFRAWLTKWSRFDKAQLKTLGVDAFFTYGVVSNINAGLTVALAWGTFSAASGLSPLVPGQWKGFFATYTGIYLSLGSVLRPFRLALAVGCTPIYTRFVSKVRDSLPFRSSRPALNRTLAIFLVSVLLNIVGTCGIIGLGVWTAGVVTGVPAFPPGWKPPFRA